MKKTRPSPLSPGKSRGISYNIRNWWYYYKWYVICGIVLLCMIARITANALGLFEKAPDVQIAYAGRQPLSGDAQADIIAAFTELCSDYNGDGTVLVRLNQYVNSEDYTDDDAYYYGYASEITLIGDITDCESYFFMTDDPEKIQRVYQILAAPDGGCPDSTDFSVDDKTIRWNDTLFLGRRCFYNDKQCENAQQCSELWDQLVNRNGGHAQ